MPQHKPHLQVWLCSWPPAGRDAPWKGVGHLLVRECLRLPTALLIRAPSLSISYCVLLIRRHTFIFTP